MSLTYSRKSSCCWCHFAESTPERGFGPCCVLHLHILGGSRQIYFGCNITNQTWWFMLCFQDGEFQFLQPNQILKEFEIVRNQRDKDSNDEKEGNNGLEAMKSLFQCRAQLCSYKKVLKSRKISGTKTRPHYGQVLTGLSCLRYRYIDISTECIVYLSYKLITFSARRVVLLL